MKHPSGDAAGIAASLAASSLFALMYYYVTWLVPLDAGQIYGWRIALTAPLIALLLVATKQWRHVTAIGRRIAGRWWLLVPLALSSFLLGVQQWIFMWSPLHGYGLDVSLGFFLLPLTMALTGRLVFGETISRFQEVACALAAMGVANELLFAPRLSWPMLVVCLGYPVYFVLRRRLRTDNLGGMWVDLALSVPVGIAMVASGSAGLALASAGGGGRALLVLGLGVISATSVTCMFVASQRLSLTLFGLLGYLEPALLVVVSLMLGESIAPSRWPTYLLIWAAILVLVAEGARAIAGAARRRGLAAAARE